MGDASGGCGQLIYVHPYNHPVDELIPLGAVALLNRLAVPHVGRYAYELTADEIRSAGCFALDLHWYFSLEAVYHIAADLKRQNPQAPIIVGGLTASFYAEHLIRQLPIDYLIAGDAEHSFPPLVEALLEGHRPPPLPNVWTPNGPPPARRPVSQAELEANDYLTLDWFPTLERVTFAAHRRYAQKPELGGSDRYFPLIPLTRSCRRLCEGCYGAYQPDVFASDQVDRSAESLGRILDAIEAHPAYSFVTLFNRTEDPAGFEVLRQALGRRRALGLRIMHFCDLPSDELLRLCCDSFRGVAVSVTAPTPGRDFPLATGRWTVPSYERRILEMARLIGSVDSCGLDVSFLTTEPSPLKAELQRRSYRGVQLKNNAEWTAPVPSRLTLVPGLPLASDAKRRQAEELRAVSRAHANATVALATAPDLWPLFELGPLQDVNGAPIRPLGPVDPRLDAFRQWYDDSFRRLYVPTLPAVAVDVEWLRLGHGSERAAGFRTIGREALTGQREPAAIELRCNGIRLSWSGPRPPLPPGEALGLVLMPQLGWGEGQTLVLRELPAVRKLVLPLPAAVTAGTELRLTARLTQQLSCFELHAAAELVANVQLAPAELRGESRLWPELRYRKPDEPATAQPAGENVLRGGPRTSERFRRLLGLPAPAPGGAGPALTRADLVLADGRIELSVAGLGLASVTTLRLVPDAAAPTGFVVHLKGEPRSRAVQQLMEAAERRLRDARYELLVKVFHLDPDCQRTTIPFQQQ